MDVCLLWVLHCQVEVSAKSLHSSRGVRSCVTEKKKNQNEPQMSPVVCDRQKKTSRMSPTVKIENVDGSIVAMGKLLDPKKVRMVYVTTYLSSAFFEILSHVRHFLQRQMGLRP